MKLSRLFPLLCVAATVHAAIQTDIEYGVASGESLRLDACVPDGAGPFPAVILVHGGGWNAGDKSGGPKKGYMAPMHDPLTAGGFAWFEINYRLAPKHHFPAALEDVFTAIRWVKAHAAEYHLDPKRIAISGESAGGQLVGLAVVRADETTRVAATVCFYGLFDLAAEVKRRGTPVGSIGTMLGHDTVDPELDRLLHDASAASYVRAGLPPFLLVHGTADASIAFQQSVDMQARLRTVGVPCELILIKDGPHGMLPWPALAPDFKDRVVAWLKAAMPADHAK